MNEANEQRLRELILEVAIRARASTQTSAWELEPREAIVSFVREMNAELVTENAELKRQLDYLKFFCFFEPGDEERYPSYNHEELERLRATRQFQWTAMRERLEFLEEKVKVYERATAQKEEEHGEKS